jgi:hypothetical protein
MKSKLVRAFLDNDFSMSYMDLYRKHNRLLEGKYLLNCYFDNIWSDFSNLPLNQARSFVRINFDLAIESPLRTFCGFQPRVIDREQPILVGAKNTRAHFTPFEHQRFIEIDRTYVDYDEDQYNELRDRLHLEFARYFIKRVVKECPEMVLDGRANNLDATTITSTLRAGLNLDTVGGEIGNVMWVNGKMLELISEPTHTDKVLSNVPTLKRYEPVPEGLMKNNGKYCQLGGKVGAFMFDVDVYASDEVFEGMVDDTQAIAVIGHKPESELEGAMIFSPATLCMPTLVRGGGIGILSDFSLSTTKSDWQKYFKCIIIET